MILSIKELWYKYDCYFMSHNTNGAQRGIYHKVMATKYPKGYDRIKNSDKIIEELVSLFNWSIEDVK